MKWFDYIAVCWFALTIWVNFMFFDLFGIAIQLLCWFLYESIRKDMVHGKD